MLKWSVAERKKCSRRNGVAAITNIPYFEKTFDCWHPCPRHPFCGRHWNRLISSRKCQSWFFDIQSGCSRLSSSIWETSRIHPSEFEIQQRTHLTLWIHLFAPHSSLCKDYTLAFMDNFIHFMIITTLSFRIMYLRLRLWLCERDSWSWSFATNGYTHKQRCDYCGAMYALCHQPLWIWIMYAPKQFYG